MATYVNGSNTISAVILAAGLSSRMGKLKPLLPFGKTTVLEHCIRLFQGCGIQDVVVVTGHRHAEIKKVAKKAGAQAVYNKHFERGMYTSIRAGALALHKRARDFSFSPLTFRSSVQAPFICCLRLFRTNGHRSPTHYLRGNAATLRSSQPVFFQY